jgi:hypothetical protein
MWTPPAAFAVEVLLGRRAFTFQSPSRSRETGSAFSLRWSVDQARVDLKYPRGLPWRRRSAVADYQISHVGDEAGFATVEAIAALATERDQVGNRGARAGSWLTYFGMAHARRATGRH